MVERVVRVSRPVAGQTRLFQLSSGIILSRAELVQAIEEGRVVGLMVRQTDDGQEMASADGDDDILDLLSPISEDDLEAYTQRGDRLPDWSDVYDCQRDRG